MNLENLAQTTKPAIEGFLGKVMSLLRAAAAQVAARRNLVDKLLAPVRRLAGALGEKLAPMLEPIRSWLAAHQHLLERPREWLRTFGFHHRPVQAVVAAMVVGTLYVAIWDPFARPLPDDPAIVAERTAPIGSVNLLALKSDQIADERDAASLPVSSLN
jgi:hypothetical protein